ncbi:hypothetical protein ASG86_12970 [Arthrobacter sp. Soil764]|nr:hypothetical protein ASG86_12970 [Arthrobacter sp. Soil764]
MNKTLDADLASMNVDAVRGDGLVRVAHTEIRKLILSGDLLPGDRVTVRPLVERLGLSATPIRTALAALERQGLLESRDHRGFFVPLLSLDDLMEIYELREALEVIASRRAAQSPSRLELANEMEQLLEQQRAVVAAGDVSGYLELDIRFHQLMWLASGNKRLVGVADNLFGQMRIGNNISARVPGRPEASLLEHEEIVEALRAGDPRAAEKAVRFHIRTAGKALSQFMVRNS